MFPNEVKEQKKLILTLDHPSNDLLDQLTLVLFELGSTGLQIESAQEYMTGHGDLYGEIFSDVESDDASTIVVAYFDELPSEALIEEHILSLSNLPIKVESAVEPIKDWQAKWMSSYQSIRLSRYLTIVPEWLDYQAEPLEQLIYLNPGAAFGTGYHETTQLAVQALETYMRGGEIVLDVGTGSGILAFVAAQLGAKQVIGYDLDPQAIESARQNLQIQKERTAGKIQQWEAVQFEVNNGLQGVQQNAELIVANILPHILIDMFDDFDRLLLNDGYLILGGIVSDQAAKIESAYQAAGFNCLQKTQLGDWLGYVLQKQEED